MRKLPLWISVCSIALAWAALAPAQTAPNSQPAPRRFSRALPTFTPAELKSFAALDPIDVHTHIYRSDPGFTSMLVRLNLHVVDILAADPGDTPTHRTFEQFRQDAWQAVDSAQGHASLSTAFDPFDWNSPDFPSAAIQSINRDFVRGAVGATIWSNTGMSLMDASGKPALPDNAKLEPVYRDMAEHHKTLFAHLTGADEAWGASPSSGQNVSGAAAAAGDLPVPPFLRARDHIAEMNPEMRVIGAHLGSVKEGLGQIGRRLDQHPDLAIDTASRVDSLMAMPRDQVRAFLMKYQDRILYGTDNAFRQNDNPAAITARWENRYAIDWRYFSSGDTFEYHGRTVQGLGLPASVLQKLYHDNAVRWVPGV